MKRAVIILAVLMVLAASITPVFGGQQAGNPGDTGAQNTAKVPGFKDISGHWAEKVIIEMASKGIIQGVGGNLFQPDRSMSRCEFAYIIDKAFDIQIRYFAAPDITRVFNDVRNEDWYASALYDLHTAGIVDDKTAFRPKEPVTREEIVHYIIRTYSYKTKIEMSTGNESVYAFSDRNSINPAYLNDVGNAMSMGLIFGKSRKLFAPKDSSSRAEVLVVIKRTLDAVEKSVVKGDTGVDTGMDTGINTGVNTGVNVEPGFEKSDIAFKMKLAIKNNTGKDVTIGHVSYKKYDFVLLDSQNNEIYRWSSGRMFPQAMTKSTIKAGESLEFTAVLDLKSYGGIIDKAVCMKAYIVGGADAFEVNKDGYTVNLNQVGN